MGFDFSVLEAAKAAKRENREKRRVETLQKLQGILLDMKDRYNLSEIYIFGSILRPYHFFSLSDLDVAVRGLSNALYFQFAAEISDRMEIDTDVVELETSRLVNKITEEGLKVG